jgi:hypothetical protein
MHRSPARYPIKALTFLLFLSFALLCGASMPRAIPVTAAGAQGEQKAAAKSEGKSEGLVGVWYYIALVDADGSEKELSNRESFLDLKADGTFENSLGVLAGRGSQVGTYSVSGSRLTLNAENREPKTYTMTFGNDGKKTHKLSGRTLKLVNKDGIGYKLER